MNYARQKGNYWVFPDGTVLPVVSGASDAGTGAGGSEPDVKELLAENARLQQKVHDLNSEAGKHRKQKNQFRAMAGLEGQDPEVRLLVTEALLDTDLPKDRRQAALRLIDASAIEVDDNGAVTGIEDAIDQLQDSYPWLWESGSTEEDEDKAKQQATGAKHNAGRRKPQGRSDKDVAQRYPSLAGRVPGTRKL